MNKKLFLLLPLFALVIGCGGGNKKPVDPTPTEPTEIDYAEITKIPNYSTLQEYRNTNFLDNGIGEVTLYNPVDGDTAHFYQKETTEGREERLVKVRFYGIDTPESTGQIQPWGKKASKFTTDTLRSAKTIVLTNGDLLPEAAQYDSTGTRFKAFVWVSEEENAPITSLKCLNLMVVQEGFSNAKGVAGCPLADVFNDADLQAQRLEKNMWSGDDPDFYTGDAMATSIKDIVEEFTASNGVCPTYEGKKVQINGIVSKVVDDDAYVIQDFEDEETGVIKRYGLFIFAGYKSYEILKKVGNDLTIIGTFTVRYGNPQITSVSYNKYLPDDDDMVLNNTGVEKPYEEMTFQQVDNKREYVNIVAKFKHLHATGKGYNQIDKTTQVASGAMNIELEDDNGYKMYLRVPKNIWLVEKDDPTSRVKDYKYLYDNHLYFDLTAAIAVYSPDNPDGEGDPSDTKTYWQLQFCHRNDIVYY